MKSVLSHNAFAVVAAAALCSMAGVARADVSVSFGDPRPPMLAPTDVAGVPEYGRTAPGPSEWSALAANWNNVTSAASNLVLNDHTGAPTAATLTTTGGSFTRIAEAVPAGPDETMNLGIITRLFSSSPPISFTVSNIPYASYDVFVYTLGVDSLGSWTSVNLGGTTIYSSSPSPLSPLYPMTIDGDPSTPYIYQRASGTDLFPADGGNYVLFENVSGPSQTITVSSFLVPASVNGFQIVEVPEPATSATLLGLGLLGCGRAARRRRA